MSKTKNKKFIIGIAAAFLLPLSLYLITKKKTEGLNPRPPYFVVDRVDSYVEDGKKVYDTVFHKVADLQLVNQYGDSISLNRDLKDKVLLVNFFFADCPSVCPRMINNMVRMQNSIKKKDTSVHFVTITVIPERDTFQRLRAYGDRYKVNYDRWWLLTGDRKSIYNFARNELHVAMQPGDGGLDDFIHSEKIVLLDKNRHIRGYFNGLDSTDLTKCLDRVGLVRLEKDRKKKKRNQ